MASLIVLVPLHSSAQGAASKRKILDQAAPAYPAIARTMGLQGIVKVDALVGPDGKVKSAQVKGGHPVLVQSALEAVRRWKWESAAHDSHELVEVKFSPE